jgi:hypothetical protein
MPPSLPRPSRLIPVDDLEGGMVLAESVHDAQGRLLIQRDTELTDRHLRAFQLWGIQSVRILGPGSNEPEPPPISSEILARAEALVRERFRHNDLEHPLIVAILRVCLMREARRLADGELVHA